MAKQKNIYIYIYIYIFCFSISRPAKSWPIWGPTDPVRWLQLTHQRRWKSNLHVLIIFRLFEQFFSSFEFVHLH